jgi:hypothetical protein
VKILFVKSIRPDYQGDMLFHGLRQIPEIKVTDFPKQEHMYKNFDGSKLYGKGFGVFGTLEDTPCDRENAHQKVLDCYYDYVIYGEIEKEDLIGIYPVLSSYSSKQIIFVDGSDWPKLLAPQLVGQGHYFKRELREEVFTRSDEIYPISFAYPAEKAWTCGPPKKTQVFATIVPGDESTYVFDKEDEYYADYRKSYYGITRKKAGWDAQRHYEIIFNRSIPYFPDLRDCPKWTMTSFPKEILLEYWSKASPSPTSVVDPIYYSQTEEKIFEHALRDMTTKALAEYVLEIIS